MKSVFKKLVPKKTRDYLYNCHDGYGFIVLKKRENELGFIEFNQGKDGSYKTFGNEKMPSFNKIFN